MRLLFLSGGSAGHLAPLVAVLRALQTMEPSAEVLFVCSDRKEDAEFLTKEKVQFEQVALPRLSWRLPVRFLKNFLKSRRILRRFQPDIVFSKGGAVSVPCALAAKMQKIPIVLHESDAVMGKANRIVARWAEMVCLGMGSEEMSDEKSVMSDRSHHSPLTTHHFVYTGNPIRPELTQGNREEGLRITGLTGERPIFLVLGGSQGAEALNEVIRKNIDALLTVCDIVHITGKGKKSAGSHVGYWSTEFATDALAHIYATASFALTRAGASSLTELAANAIPMIVVPIEGLAHNHQVHNAAALETSRGGKVIAQGRLSQDLLPLVTSWANNSQLRQEFTVQSQILSGHEASRRIAEILVQRIAEPGKRR